MLKEVFEKYKVSNDTVFIPYFPAGYPSISKSKKALLRLAKNGAGLIEIGIPFSDPLADGPTIQKASNAVLQAGFKVNQAFDLLTDLKGKLPPSIVMTYYNLLYGNGLKNFARKAAKAGVKGVIIPDLSLEEASEWLRVSKDHLETIFLVAPTSSDGRIKKIGKATTAFIYCVSLTGVTGARKNLPPNIATYLKKVRKITDKPIAVGFGVSTAEHVKQLKPLTDGIVVASAIIDTYSRAENEAKGLKNIDSFVKKIKI